MEDMRGEPWYSRWNGWIVSILFHVAIIALLVWPEQFVALPLASGGGGAGPAGGGGGGADGGGNQRPGERSAGLQGERLHYIALTPMSPSAQPAPVEPPQKEDKENVPRPVPPPPKPAETPPVAVAPSVAPPVQTPSAPVAPLQQAAPGTGEGAGTDRSGGGSGAGSAGTTGSGPGSGGGVGSGEGTGRGSSVGSGTGGGDGTKYPPTPKQFFLPPLPAPKSVSGFTLTAWFDVDSVGQAKLIRFTPSPDRGYNRRIRETLLAMKFRPAVGPDGQPVRDTVDVQFTF